MSRRLTPEDLKAIRAHPEQVLIGCTQEVAHYSREALEFSAAQLNDLYKGWCTFWCDKKTGDLHFRNPVAVSLFSMLWHAHKFCETFVGEANIYAFLVWPTIPPSMSVGIANTGFETVDLSGMQPKSGHKWVLVALGEDGPYAIEGEEKGSLSCADIPSLPSDTSHKVLAAVHLKSDTETISGWFDGPMEIVDLRGAEAPLGHTPQGAS